jgi:N-terminal domain of (some) glycogen debranching enzymes
VLVTEPDGQVIWPSVRGLYFRDTRVISAWAIYANGEPWDLLNGGAIAYHAARIFETNRAFLSEDGPIAARTLGLVIGRHIDSGEIHRQRALGRDIVADMKATKRLERRDRATRRVTPLLLCLRESA